MKPYIFIKKTSLSLIYTSLAAVFVIGIIYAVDAKKYSADEPTSVASSVDVLLSPNHNNGTEVPADSNTKVPVQVYVRDKNNTQASIKDIDHVSVFVTKAITNPKTDEFKPDDSDAGRDLICKAASENNNPLNLVGRPLTCKSDGDCGDAVWTAPSTTGLHQFFAVAMRAGSGGCTRDKILGWSSFDESQLINVYKGEVHTGEDITVSAPDQSIAGKDVNFSIKVSRQDYNKIVQVNLFTTLSGAPDYDGIDFKYVCEQMNIADASKRTLVAGTSPIFCPDGECGSIPITFNSSGKRRIVAVGMNNTDSMCVAEGENKNIVSVNKDTVIKIVNADDPSASAPVTLADSTDPTNPGGSSGGGALGSHPVKAEEVVVRNPTQIKGITDMLNEFDWLVYTFIGVIAFTGFLYAGLNYMTAGGDEKKTERAKKAMIYSITAIVLLYLSYGIVKLVLDILNKGDHFLS